MIVRVNRIPDDINSRYATFDQMRHTEYAIRFNFLFRCICFKLDFNQTKKKKEKRKDTLLTCTLTKQKILMTSAVHNQQNLHVYLHQNEIT